MSSYGIVLFYTTSAVMRAEKVLNKANVNVKLIPTPRELSSDCGIALRFDWEQAGNIEAILDEANVEIAGVYEI